MSVSPEEARNARLPEELWKWVRRKERACVQITEQNDLSTVSSSESSVSAQTSLSPYVLASTPMK